METLKTETEIRNYENTKAPFSDFTQFEDNAADRKKAKNAFINGETQFPEFNYPKLDNLNFDEDTISKKQLLYEAVLELEAAKKYSKISDAELELCASSLEVRLKRIMLAEAAKNLYDPLAMTDFETAERSFIEANESLYGEFDKNAYLGIMNSEKSKLVDFVPKNEISVSIKNDLGKLYSKIDTDGKIEKKLLSTEELLKIHNYVFENYAEILAVVPETPESVYYDVSECAKIMNDALIAGGFEGWLVEENSEKTVVSTNANKKRIYLPSSTKRNSIELKRLIMHEQEVHARRAENGEKTGLKFLKDGTAEYADIEEGMAVLLECAVNGNFENASFDRARNRYIVAGLALGADGMQRDARETFETVWRIIAVDKSDDGLINDKDINSAKDAAYTLIENAYRGTQFWMKGMIYTKLKIYYEGLVANADYFKKHIDNLDAAFDEAFIGKYDHTNIKERELILDIIKSQEAQDEEKS